MTDLSIYIATCKRSDRVATQVRAVIPTVVHGAATRKRRR